MAQETNKDQIIVRFDIENGIPRVRQVTGEELKRLLKTHQTSKWPSVSLEDINRFATALEEMNGGADTRRMSLVDNPSAR